MDRKEGKLTRTVTRTEKNLRRNSETNRISKASRQTKTGGRGKTKRANRKGKSVVVELFRRASGRAYTTKEKKEERAGRAVKKIFNRGRCHFN
jgi:hypothetical protein